ncbi:MAG TPA: subclass B3 metallo-beta-lactamase [Gemmatimonadaceae bacterium]|nr:subclass B3 metallo-beta-lactamase [Gemmatimonadaceae bacterium]
MGFQRLVCFVAPFVVAPALLWGQVASSLSAGDRQRIDSVFKAYDKPHVPGCALGVFRDGRMAYGRGYGWADLEHAVPITTASLFDIGSTSKQFTAASIALLAEDHKLAFTDDVRKYIPELPDYGEPITIDELMRHTSGLRDYDGLLPLAGVPFEQVSTDSQALAIIVSQRRLNFTPRSRWEYTNTGFFLLSIIVQRVTGQSLADFERDRIFRPLGMTHTIVRNHAAMLIPNRAMGYAPGDSAGFKNSMSNWEQTGDGSVQLSVDDALKWDENYYHPRVGGPWMVEQLQTRGTLANGDSTGYGRGLFVGTYRGVRRFEHGGAWIGYRAAYERFPDQHTSIIALCNSDGISPNPLAEKVADIVLAKQFKTGTAAVATADHAKPNTTSAITTDRLVGSYFDSTTDQVYRIADNGGKPALVFSGQQLPLDATGPSTFAVHGIPITVTFSADETGPARALRLRILSDDEPEAVRFAPAAPDANALHAYEGRYGSPELGASWSIAVVNDHLVVSGPIAAVEIAGKLEPAMRDGFTANGGTLLFTRDDAGRVTGFTLSASRMKGIRFDRSTLAQQDLRPGPMPADVPPAWKSLIGDYGPPGDSNPLIVFERDGKLLETQKGGETKPYSKPSLPRRDYVSTTGNYVVNPPRPVSELRQEALRATPPAEAGPFRKPDLVEVAKLDPAIHLDVRYATTNNFLRTPVYTEARAFLQRPAAEALVRVMAKLKPLGYGLLIHDAYRPWYVTKIFWDATPAEGKIFVADPSQGSRHNRGCAVDLTLYDLKTGQPIEMPGTYDEMSPRSYPDYPGGTSLQRWHRELLRAAMESEGYKVYEAEWWHFDYKDWREYPILNIPFEKLGAAVRSSAIPPAWTNPVKPFRIVGDVYYVGTEGLAAYLIKSPGGAVLLDGTLEENAPLIERNIQSLGVPLRTVKLLISDHAHNDHVGALAQLKKDTGAPFAASAGDRYALEHGWPRGQFNYTPTGFPPIAVDRVVADNETLHAGSIAITAHLTPGHTPGCTSWSTTVREDDRPVNVLFLCSITVAGNVLVKNAVSPNIATDYEATFKKLEGMQADVVLTSHPEMADILAREGRHQPGQPNPFIDPGELATIVGQARQDFASSLASDSTVAVKGH